MSSLEYCKVIALRCRPQLWGLRKLRRRYLRSGAMSPMISSFFTSSAATFATMHLQGGVDILTVSKWLGHKELKTTMRYLTAARGEDVRKKVNAGALATAFSPQAIRGQ